MGELVTPTAFNTSPSRSLSVLTIIRCTYAAVLTLHECEVEHRSHMNCHSAIEVTAACPSGRTNILRLCITLAQAELAKQCIMGLSCEPTRNTLRLFQSIATYFSTVPLQRNPSKSLSALHGLNPTLLPSLSMGRHKAVIQINIPEPFPVLPVPRAY